MVSFLALLPLLTGQCIPVRGEQRGRRGAARGGSGTAGNCERWSKDWRGGKCYGNGERRGKKWAVPER
jgi:hypothetical protein